MKMPATACDLLYDRVLPFYDALGIGVGAILTDNGREFCGRPERRHCVPLPARPPAIARPVQPGTMDWVSLASTISTVRSIAGWDMSN